MGKLRLAKTQRGCIIIPRFALQDFGFWCRALNQKPTGADVVQEAKKPTLVAESSGAGDTLLWVLLLGDTGGALLDGK